MIGHWLFSGVEDWWQECPIMGPATKGERRRALRSSMMDIVTERMERATRVMYRLADALRPYGR